MIYRKRQALMSPIYIEYKLEQVKPVNYVYGFVLNKNTQRRFVADALRQVRRVIRDKMKIEDKTNNIEFMIKSIDENFWCLSYMDIESFNILKRQYSITKSLSAMQKKYLFNLWEKVNNR